MRRARPSKTRRRMLPEKYYKWLLPALGVAAVAAAFLIFLFAKGELKTELPADCYQLTLGDREEFSRGDTVLETDTGLVVERDGLQQGLDVTPFYHKEGRTITLSQDMIWCDGASHKERSVPALSSVTVDEAGAVWCQVSGKEILLTGGFLTDGQGTYVFLDETTVTVNGVAKTLPALSFYSVVGGLGRLWHYGDAEVTWVEKLQMNVQAESVLGYGVDLTAAIYTGKDGVKRMLAASPAAVPKLS